MKFYARNRVYLCIWIFVSNKVVEGSGSEGTSKYMRVGVTYGVFLGTLATFFARVHLLTCLRQLSAHSCLCHHDITSWYGVT